mmetsp:Transcript_2905/g.5434  ORF Transcript_2905/g.5434 Transcript_2905/m.5434 type:complete len:263 (+) Transcript_2905:939-1727(+)
MVREVRNISTVAVLRRHIGKIYGIRFKERTSIRHKRRRNIWNLQPVVNRNARGRQHGRHILAILPLPPRRRPPPPSPPRHARTSRTSHGRNYVLPRHPQRFEPRYGKLCVGSEEPHQHTLDRQVCVVLQSRRGGPEYRRGQRATSPNFERDIPTIINLRKRSNAVPDHPAPSLQGSSGRSRKGTENVEDRPMHRKNIFAVRRRRFVGGVEKHVPNDRRFHDLGVERLGAGGEKRVEEVRRENRVLGVDVRSVRRKTGRQRQR